MAYVVMAYVVMASPMAHHRRGVAAYIPTSLMCLVPVFGVPAAVSGWPSV